jgi:hypothetical protein
MRPKIHAYRAIEGASDLGRAVAYAKRCRLLITLKNIQCFSNVWVTAIRNVTQLPTNLDVGSGGSVLWVSVLLTGGTKGNSSMGFRLSGGQHFFAFRTALV